MATVRTGNGSSCGMCDDDDDDGTIDGCLVLPAVPGTMGVVGGFPAGDVNLEAAGVPGVSVICLSPTSTVESGLPMVGVALARASVGLLGVVNDDFVAACATG